MKKFISLFLIFLTSLSLGANNPETPPLGGTGVSNPLANTITVNSPMVFPDNINLQFAYEHSGGYPHSKITLPSDGELVVVNDLNYTVVDIGAQFGVYSEVGFSGSFEVGNFGIGINTVDAASTFFSVSPVDTSVGFGTLPYPDFNSAAEGTINLTNAPKGLTLYNIDTNTLDIYNGTAFKKILSTNNILAGNQTTVTDNGNGTVTIGTTGIVAITQALTSQTMVDSAFSNRYFVSNVSLLTLTLPTSPSVGHIYEIVGAGNAPWKIAQNGGQAIVTSVNGVIVSTTPGTSGHADGANSSDCIDLMYVGGGVFIVKSEQTSGTGVVLN